MTFKVTTGLNEMVQKFFVTQLWFNHYHMNTVAYHTDSIFLRAMTLTLCMRFKYDISKVSTEIFKNHSVFFSIFFNGSPF